MNQDEFGLLVRPGMTHRDRVERAFRLFGFGNVLPAYSNEAGHRRTPYFYRKTAISFARMARDKVCDILAPGSCATFSSLAKSYLASYLKAKAAA